MATYLKQGLAQAEVEEADAKVRTQVETILDEIQRYGDDAVRKLSEQFDGWIPSKWRANKDAAELRWRRVVCLFVCLFSFLGSTSECPDQGSEVRSAGLASGT